MNFKKLSEDNWDKLKSEIKMMLHAHRDCLRNKKEDTTKLRFDCRDGYYGEAFGILRALHVLGYGTYFGAVNIPEDRTNLNWWMRQIENEVLREENYGSSNECDYCLERYKKDAVRKR